MYYDVQIPALDGLLAAAETWLMRPCDACTLAFLPLPYVVPRSCAPSPTPLPGTLFLSTHRIPTLHSCAPSPTLQALQAKDHLALDGNYVNHSTAVHNLHSASAGTTSFDSHLGWHSSVNMSTLLHHSHLPSVAAVSSGAMPAPSLDTLAWQV